jgi:hypothetical protein
MDCFVASAFARRRASADKSAPRNDDGGFIASPIKQLPSFRWIAGSSPAMTKIGQR